MQVQGLVAAPSASEAIQKLPQSPLASGIRSTSSPALEAVRALVRERGVIGLMRGYWVSA